MDGKLRSVKKGAGIYVEILIQDDLDRIWQLTQDPIQHEKWDLRFTRIRYLPRTSSEEPQEFLYCTRLGFGIGISGTGSSRSARTPGGREAISSLQFASDDRFSLIRSGSGYWKYVSTSAGTRFLTWYDYDVRFGAPGRYFDRFVFRPLLGWATAWSFDRLRLWVEGKQSPEASLALFVIHFVARLSLAFVWIWQGLVPKLLYDQRDERQMLAQVGLSPHALPWIGAGEILIGMSVLGAWNVRAVFAANGALMILGAAIVAAKSPDFIAAAFNPITHNAGVLAIALSGWFASKTLPSARTCRRVPPRG